MNNKETHKIFERIIEETNDIDSGLLELREYGCSQMESLKILKSVLGLTIGEADKLIMNSKTWSDQKELNSDMRDEFEKYLNSLNIKK